VSTRSKPAVRKPAPGKTSARKPTATRARKPATKRTAATKARRAPAKKKKPPVANDCTYSFTQFRSQLEARWAIFFDCLGLDWDYEPCHYPVGDGLGYLPDFYLPTLGVWAEGKGPTFLDRHSMGKIINGAAGPQPLPIREAPYGPADQVLILGPFPKIDIGTPTHNIVVPEGGGIAGVRRSIWTPDGPELVDTKPWITFPANGASPARRPTPKRTEELLNPGPLLGVQPDRLVSAAYKIAFETRFDVKGNANVPHQAHSHLRNRRRGRPLSPRGAVHFSANAA